MGLSDDHIRGALGCDRQVVHYSTNLRRTPYELRVHKCGHRAIKPERSGLRWLVPGYGPHAAGQHKGGPPGPSASRAKQCTATLRSDAGTVWTDAHACCSEADFVGAAGAASPVV